MTVESPVAHDRPPDDVASSLRKLTSNRNRTNSPTFHDYALPYQSKSATTKMEVNTDKVHSLYNPVTPLCIVPEHSLAAEWNIVSSPGNSLMYEVDPMDNKKALLSPCTSDVLHSPISTSSWKRDGWDQPMEFEEESIDLKDCDSAPFWGQMDGPPIQDYLTDLMSGSDGCSIKAIGDGLVAVLSNTQNNLRSVKIEPGTEQNCSIDPIGSASLQTVLKDTRGHGPTLAQLNDRESVLDLGPSRPPTNWGADGANSRLPGILPHSDSSNSLCTTTLSWNTSFPFTCPSSAPNMTAPGCASSQKVATPRPCSSATLTSTGLPACTPSDLQNDNLVHLVQVSSDSPVPGDVAFEQMDVPKTVLVKSQEVRKPTFMAKGLGLVSRNVNQTLQKLFSDGQLQATCGSGRSVLTSQRDDSGMPPQKAMVYGKRKGSHSPNNDSNASPGSVERKWEEIRDYIDSSIKEDEQKAKGIAKGKLSISGRVSLRDDEDQLPSPKKLKVEPQDTDVAYTPQEDFTSTVKEEFESDFDNSDDDDFSDADSDASYTSFVDDLLHGNKKDKARHFWQYNIQSKGPKGKRLCKSMHEIDPHTLADFEDPVFQPDVNDVRYKHNGKARKGDGNDITPSPWKLFQIGNELQKLNKKINGIGVQIKPVKTKDGVKSKSRKEKNKYASRACRLKKKAQHEANKLKLYGLEQEHHELIMALQTIKRNVYQRVKNGVITEGENCFSVMLDKTMKQSLSAMIAGNTADFVNSVLEKVAEGDRSGGLDQE